MYQLEAQEASMASGAAQEAEQAKWFAEKTKEYEMTPEKLSFVEALTIAYRAIGLQKGIYEWEWKRDSNPELKNTSAVRARHTKVIYTSELAIDLFIGTRILTADHDILDRNC